VLCQVTIELHCHLILLGACIVHKLEFSKCLKSVQGNAVEFVQRDCASGVLVI
jgi:hypothetical protein